MTRAVFAVLILCLCGAAQAGDPTGYWARESAAGRAPSKEWWNTIASGKGLCCSFADGKKVEDVDWDTEGGHYRVRLDGEWIVVPDDAVVSEPNKYGAAVVWPYDVNIAGDSSHNASHTYAIRCFMPGAGG